MIALTSQSSLQAIKLNPERVTMIKASKSALKTTLDMYKRERT